MNEPEQRPTPPIVRAALELAELYGVRIALAHHVISFERCSCADPECKSPGKHPLHKDWQKLATSDPTLILAGFARHPNANFGIATGMASGVVVLDVDGPEGEASLAELEAKHGALPRAPQVVTSRGRHIYFAAGSIPLRNRAGKAGHGLGVGLDFRAEGGFVVCPPSIHGSGMVYQWNPAATIGAVDPPPLPDWIVAKARDQERPAPAPLPQLPFSAERADKWAQGAFTRELEAVRGAPKGERNKTLNTASFNLGTIVGGGKLDASTVRRALREAGIAAGLTEFETVKTITSGLAAGIKAETRDAPTRDIPGGMTRREMQPASSSASSSAAESSSEPTGPAEPTVAPQPSAMQPRFDTAALFAALPAQRWCVPGLQIGPGRPTLIAGYGSSAKTLASQSLALSLASGHAVWGRFDSSPMTVLHIDYEQGYFATAKRYQRLAIGHGIDLRELENRLHYIEMPRVYLDKRGCEDEYLRACEGVDLVIIDALRGAAPFTDENDSSFRQAIDVLTYVSQRTGCSFLVLHHASKPKKDSGNDARTLARGSSAIYDASGCVFNFVARPGDDARLVTQVKVPAEAEGATLEPFELVVSDVEIDGNAKAGVRCMWRVPLPVDESAKAEAEFERDAALILKAVSKAPGGQSNVIVSKCGVSRVRALEVLRALAEEGRLDVTAGKNRARFYRVPTRNDGGSK